MVSTRVCGLYPQVVFFTKLPHIYYNYIMPIIKQCVICGSNFKTKPFFIKNGGGKYCSRACHHNGIKTGKIMKCFLCGKDTYKTKKQLRVSKSKKYFCTKSCQTKWRNTVFVGSRHTNWKEGRYAYKGVLKRHKIPQFCKICKTNDERVLAVHHIDRNKTNNRVNNLVWLCHNCHHLVHNYNIEQKKIMVIVAQ